MPWWETVFFLIVAGLSIWGFCSMVAIHKRFLTRRTSRSAQDLVDYYAGSPKDPR
ncbi:MAG TPA: hypothetical protein VH089_15675 [Streptosporangiaceae bacterium]|jgi:hypothetical protein|nr:hypothetical protein [Streptosporangiaceae bacterium]